MANWGNGEQIHTDGPSRFGQALMVLVAKGMRLRVQRKRFQECHSSSMGAKTMKY